VTKLRGIIWRLESNRDLGVAKLVLASDYSEVIEAINGPYHWPQYQTLLEQVFVLKLYFTSITFEVEIVLNNSIARNIAKSVLGDGRLQSYLALGRPAWLHDRLL
ncbi:unnamed protein product, partial [Brassica napus]